jgi:hypothetical protein
VDVSDGCTTQRGTKDGTRTDAVTQLSAQKTRDVNG